MTRMHIAKKINKDEALQGNQAKKFVPKVNLLFFSIEKNLFQLEICTHGFQYLRLIQWITIDSFTNVISV